MFGIWRRTSSSFAIWWLNLQTANAIACTGRPGILFSVSLLGAAVGAPISVGGSQMTRRSHLLLTLLVPVAATSLAAQSNPRFEVGGFGTFTKFANAMALQDRIGAGGRFALHFSPKLAVELQAIYLGPSTAAGSAKYFFHTGSASLMVGGGSQRLSFFALGGVTRFDMGSQFPYDYGLTGFHGGAGFRFGLTERLALRVDGRGG